MIEEKGMIAREIDDYDRRHPHDEEKLDNISKIIDDEISKIDEKHMQDETIRKIAYKKGQRYGENFKKREDNYLKEDNSENTKNPNLFNDKGEMDFVNAGTEDILNFIQEKTREKGKIEKEASELTETKRDKILKAESDYLVSEEVKKLGTGNERKARAKALVIENKIAEKESIKLDELNDESLNIRNELQLAEKIYKLKNYPLTNGVLRT